MFALTPKVKVFATTRKQRTNKRHSVLQCKGKVLQFQPMPRKKKRLWVPIVTAVISALYEVAGFFGLPPYADSPIARTVAFLIFAGALLRIIYAQNKELESFYHPEFDLTVEGLDKLQRDSLISLVSADAVYWRIVVANNSEILLKKCRVVLESWTFSSVGLNADTALTVKDEVSAETDIPGKDRKQFNFLINVLNKGTNTIAAIRVQVPNLTFVSSPVGPYSAILRINGNNMDTRRYKAMLLIDPNQGIRITRVIEI